LAKQKNDDYQFAQMQNVATVPLETGTDGGMNRVFMSRLENPTYSYDNEGHLHVPPLQPGRLPPQISTKESSYAAINNASSGGVSGFFGGLFNKNGGSTRVAATDTSSTGSTAATTSAPTHTGFFSSLFGSNHDTQQANASGNTEPTATAAAPPAKPNKPAAPSLRPRINPESRKSETQIADTAKPKSTATASAATTPAPAPQKEANGAPPPASNNGMLTGAQPVVPAGSFNSRWGFQ
jgi:hypothetical protein